MLKYDDVQVRWGSVEDAQFLAGMTYVGQPEDWEDPKVHTQWLIAEAYDVPLACAQVIPSRPIGRVEELAIMDNLSPREKHAVILKMGETCVQVLHACGCLEMRGHIPHRMKGYKRMLKKRFFGHVLESGNLMTATLRK